jgi:hypothetical protein
MCRFSGGNEMSMKEDMFDYAMRNLFQMALKSGVNNVPPGWYNVEIIGAKHDQIINDANVLHLCFKIKQGSYKNSILFESISIRKGWKNMEANKLAKVFDFDVEDFAPENMLGLRLLVRFSSDFNPTIPPKIVNYSQDESDDIDYEMEIQEQIAEAQKEIDNDMLMENS